MAQGSTYLAEITTADGGRIVDNGQIIFLDSTNQPVPNTSTITSGALPQLSAWASGTAQQNPVARPITVVVVPTDDATNNAATVAIAISPDNTTYTTIGTWTNGAALNNLAAEIDVIPVPLPQSWYIKLTISAHASVAQSYYY